MGGSAANAWSREQLEYQLRVYKLACAALKVFGEQKIFFVGSLAMSTYFEEHERRIVSGVDVALLAGEAELDEEGFRQVCEKINLEFERENLACDIQLKETTIRLGYFEALKNAGQGRLRLVALVSGGHMALKKSCRLVPSGGSKLAYLDGDKNISELKVSPIYLDIWGGWPHLQRETQIQLVSRAYTNEAARSAGYPPVVFKAPPLEHFVAAKLNMIYQSSINENIIRATPLAAHYAIKNGRQKVSAVDIYDFVLGARQVNPISVKRALKPMLVEPVNAVLDMTVTALNRLSAGKYHEELNNLLPENRALTQDGWKALCAEAAARIRKIREA